MAIINHGLVFNTVMGMDPTQKNNPQHGVTLEQMLTDLVDYFGWKGLHKQIPLQCFFNEPSIKSSLKFLRRTPWARAKVEELDAKMRRK